MIIARESGFAINGPVTLGNAAQLRAEGLRQFGASSGNPVEIDCSGVTEVDSSALSLLFEWQRVFAKQGRTLRFSNLPENMRSLASVYEVQDLLPTT